MDLQIKSLFCASLMLLGSGSYAAHLNDGLFRALDKWRWHHGSLDCSTDNNPPIEVVSLDRDTYILRQNKCLNYEAPFIYVMIGTDTVFVQDTGATEDPELFPLYETIRTIVEQHPEQRERQWLVTHSHSHGDHKAADAQFRGRPGVTLVEANGEAVRKQFGFEQWPDGEARVDLGGRELRVFPIPGHHDDSIAVYDPRTGWLLTGDTLYPGRLYVKNWQEFKASIGKLLDFSRANPVSSVMGTHIEMSVRPGEDYPIGSTHQPDEAPLPLPTEILEQLHGKLEEAGDKAARIVLPRVIVYPTFL